MHAIRKLAPEPGAVEAVEIERPTPNRNEVLVNVAAAGVCGTDAHIYAWEGYDWMTTPVTLGHEFSGTVEAVGEGVESFEQGDRVVAVPIRSCRACFQCRNGQEHVCDDFVATGVHVDGGFANYVTMPAEWLLPVPEGLSLETAALTEPAAVGTHAVTERGEVTIDDHVVVQGVGPIGVLTAYAARAATPASVTLLGTNDDEQVRFPRLRNLGFETINIQQADIAEVVDERTNGRGADVVFDATGVPTGLEQGLSMTRKGGRIVVIGTPADPGSLDIASLVRSETDILGSYSARLRDFRRAMTLLRDYVEIESLVTQYDIDEPTKPLDDMLNNQAIKPLFSFE